MSFKSGNISFYESTFQILINNGRKYIGLFRRVNNLQTFQSFKQGNNQFFRIFRVGIIDIFFLGSHEHFEQSLFICNFVHVCFNPNKAHRVSEDPCFSVNDDVCANLELAVQCQVFRQSSHVS